MQLDCLCLHDEDIHWFHPQCKASLSTVFYCLFGGFRGDHRSTTLLTYITFDTHSPTGLVERWSIYYGCMIVYALKTGYF